MKKTLCCWLPLMVLLVLVWPAGAFILQNPKDPNVHSQQLKFNLAPGEARSIPLPRQDCPVEVNVALTGVHDSGIPSPPILLVGWIMRDSLAGKTRSRAILPLILRQDCNYNDPVPPGLFDCGFSAGGKL